MKYEIQIVKKKRKLPYNIWKPISCPPIYASKVYDNMLRYHIFMQNKYKNEPN